MPIAPGTRLGPYVVQESIGQGAMGVVYRAYHAQLERTGAVKVLQALSPDEETTARFRREAQAIAHMRHPNVLNVFDFGDHEGVPYMIVEYVEGGSLSGRLKRSDLTPAQAVRYLRGIGSALDYAHSLGIVHRDVKPANVLLGPNDTPILADFGLAKLLQSSSIKSITGVTTGTPAYMAPEQVTGEDVGPAADRYSLAVMAFEMLAGSLPFEDAGVLEVLYAHVHREPPHPSTRNATLTSRVDAILLRGLDKNPSSRWETCDAFVSALERALPAPGSPAVERTIVEAPPVAATVIARPPVAVAAAPAPASMTAVAPTAASQQQQRKRRLGLLWIAAALILLLTFGTAAVLLINRPTLDVRPGTVAAGGRVTVFATHIPKNQPGEIELHSQLHVFAFRADNNGNVIRDIVIPADTPVGDHTVSICWNGTCHASQPLNVVSGVAEVTPGTSPVASTAGGPSPTSSPTRAPSPGASPVPSPTPSTNPCPTPPAPATLKASSGTVVGGNAVTLTGASFTPNRTVSLKYYKGTATSPQTTWTAGASCKGGFITSVTTSTGIARTDHITACDPTGRCAQVYLSILL